MDKFAFIDELISMIRTGELKTVEGADDSIKMLEDMQLMVMESLHNEIIRDITDERTEYYAPEFKSWQQFFSYCNGNADYEKVLCSSFSQKELETLWQNSHIAEELREKEIEEKLLLEITQLKMLEIKQEASVFMNPILMLQTKEAIKARIVGLYNLLYEN